MTKPDEANENGLRYWGEEKNDDAVYSVYLKKLRYHHVNNSSNNSDSEDNVSHLEWETVRVKLLKAGSLDRLVRALELCWTAAGNDSDATYTAVFLSTFRAFTTPSHLLSMIENRYEELYSGRDSAEDTTEQRRSLRVALMFWMDSHTYDFDHPPHYGLLRRLMAVCARFAPETAEVRLKAQYRLDKFITDIAIAKSMPTLILESTRSHSATLTFATINELRFAKQLTRMDAELFRRVVPHQCLGSTWSKRKGVDASSVAATVDQFNAVSYCVVSTLLQQPSLRPVSRVKLLAKWLDIAQELRLLKNFSSLKAIIAGLQSSPVHRLKQTWSLLGKHKTAVFEDLALIFSNDNNMLNQRQLLQREGTAKHADPQHDGTDRHNLKTKMRRVSSGVSGGSDVDRSVNVGTIPYLGTFLTDLMFLHMALPDLTPDGLLNFEKRRKEFEILAQIRLLQGACAAYCFEPDPEFEAWFDSVLVLEDAEAHQVSCLAEPLHSAVNSSGLTATASSSVVDDSVSCSSGGSSAAVTGGGGTGGGGGCSSASSSGRSGKKHKMRFGHRKNDSATSVSSCSSFDQLAGVGSTESAGHEEVKPTATVFSTRRGGSEKSQRDSSIRSLETSLANMSTNSDCSLGSLEISATGSAVTGSISSSQPNSALTTPTSASTPPTSALTTPTFARSPPTLSLSTPTSASTPPTSALTTPINKSTPPTTALTRMTSDPVCSTPMSRPVTLTPNTSSPYIHEDYYIIRVSVRCSSDEAQGANLYKSIMLTNSQRTGEVISAAMQKHDIEGSPDDYQLVQQLSGGAEYVIPPNVNVYYAVNTAHQLNFVLSSRRAAAGSGAGSSSATKTRNLGALLRRKRLIQ